MGFDKGLGTGLEGQYRGEVAAILSRLLADEYVLRTTTRGFHRNVSPDRRPPTLTASRLNTTAVPENVRSIKRNGI